jgi:hypothetical protein
MFRMQPVGAAVGGWVQGYERSPGSDQTYPKGTPVTWDTSSQELDEHAGTTTVTNIAGVSLEGVASGVADNPSGKVNFAHAAHPQLFMAKLTNGSGTVQTVDEANIDVLYGILKNGLGASQWWSVDEDDTTNVVVQVVDIDTERNVVIFMFIDSAVQVATAFS